MQSVEAAFTAEEKDSVRKIAQNLQVSWKKESTLGGVTFTIGSSSIGGNDIIGLNPGAIGSPGNYRYFDETDYVTALAWERMLNFPTGGITKALAEAHLSNTSGRFTPRHMGGSGELFTSIEPRKPMIINAGFRYGGIDNLIPQFAGIIDKQPEVDRRTAQVHLYAGDYMDYFQNKYLDQNVIFTGQRTDEVLETLFSQLGMSTAQYDLDMGINIIPFGLFPSGSKFSDVIHKIVEAENGQFYQDEEGIFRFENRQHWDSAPHNSVQKLVLTGQVINAEIPKGDHLINVIEVKGSPRQKQPNQLVWQSTAYAGSGTITLPKGEQTEIWASFDDPMLEIDTPVQNGTVGQTSFYVANSEEDGTGTDITSNITIKHISKFANATKILFQNNSATVDAYIVNLDIWGRPARRSGNVYFRGQVGASVTAYEERSLLVENDYIQSQTWAESYGQMILNDYSSPENMQRLTIRAIPELQLGDLISWQGRYWRTYGIRTTLEPSAGFIQELTLLQRDITTYFRIGVSTIGGTDLIAP